MQANLIWRERSCAGGAEGRRRPSSVPHEPVTALQMVCRVSGFPPKFINTSLLFQDELSHDKAEQIKLDWTPGLSVWIRIREQWQQTSDFKNIE